MSLIQDHRNQLLEAAADLLILLENDDILRRDNILRDTAVLLEHLVARSDDRVAEDRRIARNRSQIDFEYMTGTGRFGQ